MSQWMLSLDREDKTHNEVRFSVQCLQQYCWKKSQQEGEAEAEHRSRNREEGARNDLAIEECFYTVTYTSGLRTVSPMSKSFVAIKFH